MDAAEAAARVEEWLRLTEATGLRVDLDNVMRVPEGWSVPYNSVAYLDGTEPLKEIFPAPSLIVRYFDGQLRHSGPQPWMCSVPAEVPGQRHLVELVDPEVNESGLAYLGVPINAVMAWEDPKTGERIDSPVYLCGGLRKGMRRPDHPVEWLMVYRNAGWLDDEQFLVALTQMDVYLPRTPYGHMVYASPLALGPDQDKAFWRKVSLSEYVTSVPADAQVMIRGAQRSDSFIAGDLVRTLQDFPRVFPPVDEEGTRYDQVGEIVDLVRATATELDYKGRLELPRTEVEHARENGWELTEQQVRSIVRGKLWLQSGRPLPPDPYSVGLRPSYDDDGRLVAVLDTYGKYDNKHHYGWKYSYPKVLGAFIGFALGEALGRLDQTRFNVPATLPLGPLTRRLLAMTDGLIRGPQRTPTGAQVHAAAEAGLTATDGWLPRALGPVPPVPNTMALGLVSALPAALLDGGPSTAPAGGVPAAAWALTSEEDRQPAAYLAEVLAAMMVKEPLDNRLWLVTRQIEGVDVKLPHFNDRGLLTTPSPTDYGTGQDAVTVLRQAFSAVSGYEHLADYALARAVTHGGNRPLVGAIAGALLGTHVGMPGLPWQYNLTDYAAVDTIATDAYRHFNHASPRNSPGEWDRRYPPLENE
ncbi:YrhB domain-containing protein [Actinokineospora enzanensis]|uniref:YrhB domain-containing protein n=1 Tax=Actinokineospora enzanensis TaxID=155975 RepID=UPI00036A0636|nr:YrhB domain-containing protein [Actinokineospora enzanensis]